MVFLPQELITSATTLGALLGALGAGTLSDYTGRRLVLGIADVIFIGGALGQAVSHDVWSMVCPNPPTSATQTKLLLTSTHSIDWK